jgi:3-phosphoshikimate 1-carboxyvinyltransferase
MYKILSRQASSNEVLIPPISKSDAIRRAILNFILGQDFVLTGEIPDDVLVVQQALTKLNSSEESVSLEMSLGGAPLRFIAGLAIGITGKKISIDAEEPLRVRPHKPLQLALQSLADSCGIQTRFDEWPWIIDTREARYPKQLNVEVEPTSSQFVTALLFFGARAISQNLLKSLQISLSGEPASKPYLHLTIGWLQKAGFEVEWDQKGILISSWNRTPFNYTTPYDWSGAGYLLAAGWQRGNPVRISREYSAADACIIEIMERSGVDVSIDGEQAKLTGKMAAGIEFDVASAPDLAPTVAVLALNAPHKSVFTNVGILQDKESDRLAYIIDLFQYAAGEAILDKQTLTLTPATDKTCEILVASKKDHRRIMATACLPAFGWQNVRIDEVDDVSKSFPGFWREIAKAGIITETY